MLYKKIDVKSFADLPKKDGVYLACNKSNRFTRRCPFEQEFVDLWLRTIEWYLEPVEEGQTIVAYEWYNSTTGHAYVDYTAKYNVDKGTWMTEAQGYEVTPLFKYGTPIPKEETKSEVSQEWINEILDKTNGFVKQLISDHFNRHKK